MFKPNELVISYRGGDKLFEVPIGTICQFKVYNPASSSGTLTALFYETAEMTDIAKVECQFKSIELSKIEKLIYGIENDYT